MVGNERISAITGPAAPVFPPGQGFLGIVMLDTRFPRPRGDIGNPSTFAVPTRRLVVSGAFPQQVVQSAAGLRQLKVIDAFAPAVRRLEAEGAAAITTSCGFLVLLQEELQAAVKVPVVTSSLLLLPALLEREPQVGVLTISALYLGDEHLLAAGVSAHRLADVVVQGVAPEGEFASAILGNRDVMDMGRAQASVVSAALELKARAPTLRTVVLECTNMPPYADAVRAATGFELRSLLDAEPLRRSFSVPIT
jgi:hypothetical protein